MKTKETFSRRNFLQLSASFGMLAGLGSFKFAQAAPVQDYKALVCLFMFGGNDGHNAVVPLAPAQYSALSSSARRVDPPAQPIAADQRSGARAHSGCITACRNCKRSTRKARVAIIPNVGMLVQPTSFQNASNPNFPLPANLRSHSDQVVEMQTGSPNSGGSTGWGGRTADLMQANNAGTSFPSSISPQWASALLHRRHRAISTVCNPAILYPKRNEPLASLRRSGARLRASANRRGRQWQFDHQCREQSLFRLRANLTHCSNPRAATRPSARNFRQLRSAVSSERLRG